MADNRVLVRLDVIDSLTPKLSQITGALNATLGMGGLLGALSAVTAGFTGFASGINQAMKIDVSSIAQAGDLATKLGINFQKARGVVADTRQEIAKMAAALPGETADFNNIAQAISSTVAGISQGSAEVYKNKLKELTQSYGVLGAIAGSNNGFGAQGLNKLLSGTASLNEVSRIDLFQRNPQLLEAIRKEAGGRDLKALSTQQRFDILNKAGKRAVTSDTLAAFEGTLDSQIQTVKTKLFDPDVGIFGFFRKIDTRGGRTGLDAISNLFYGLTDLSSQVGKLTGFRGDSIMEGFIDIVDWFSDLTNYARGLNRGGSVQSLVDFLFKLPEDIVSGLNKALTSGTKFLSRVNWTESGRAIGAFIGKLFGDLLTKTDWSAVGRFIEAGLKATGQLVLGSIQGAFEGLLKSFNDLTSSFAKLQTAIQNLLGFINKISQFQGFGGLGGVFQNAPDIIKKGGEIWTKPFEDKGLLPKPKPSTQTNTENKTSFAPTININGAMSDPQAVAQAVMDTLNQQWREFSTNTLA
jgi:hypothetical protein